MLFTMIALLETIIGFWLLARKKGKTQITSSPRQQTSTTTSRLEAIYEESNRDEGGEEVNQQCEDTKDFVAGDDIELTNRRQFNKSIKHHWNRLTSSPQSQSEFKAKLRSLDRLFLILVPVSYFLFLIIMFASNRSWEDPKIPGEPNKFAAWLY